MFNNTNSVELVGKSAVFSGPLDAAFSNHMTRVRIDAGKADPRYVNAYLRHLYHRRFFEARATRWVGQAAFGPSQLKVIIVPLLPLAEQTRIVTLLERARDISRRASEARKKASFVVPAVFHHMFDRPEHASIWPLSTLGETCDVQGGLQVTSKRSELPLEMPYLRVANVLRGRLDLTEIKSIRLTEAERTRSKLVKGDVLLVEGHGNPNEVGRAAIWDGSIDACSHQNHLIRARVRTTLLPEYLAFFLNSEDGRRILIGDGKTTSGLSTISTRNVKEVSLRTPPLALQRKFADFARQVDAAIHALEKASSKANDIVNAVSHQVFGDASLNDR